MKKIIWLVLPFLFVFSNCKKDENILFEMEYFYDFTITAGLNPFSGTSGAIDRRSVGMLKERRTSNVEQITIEITVAEEEIR